MKIRPEPGDRCAPIEISADEFRKLGHRLVDDISDFLASIRHRKVTAGLSPDQLAQFFDSGRPLPQAGVDPGLLLEGATRLLFDYSLFNGHPRFWGYITSSPAPIGVLGDMLAAAVNPNVGAWKLSPLATEIEVQTIRWIAELIGYPAGCGGLLVSGGNMANFVCFLTARMAKSDGDIRKLGIQCHSQQRLRVYGSSETHTWLQKAADLFGLGTDAIGWIATDGRQRLDTGELRRQIENDRRQGMRPFMVVGTAGTVSTGAIDRLPEIAALCREENLWFHVDGAYGGFAAAVPDVAEDIRALSEADSVAVDPHKWLYAPLEAGCALVRKPEGLRNAFSYHPPYYHFDAAAVNYFDLGPQNSRGFRALKIWLSLQQAGRDGYVKMIGEDIRLAQELYRQLTDYPELQALTLNLSIATFRFVPADLRSRLLDEQVAAYLNELNQELLLRLEKGGEAFLSNAVIDGCFALRLCIVNFRTASKDVEALPGIVTRIGREVDAAMRKRGEAGAAPGGFTCP